MKIGKYWPLFFESEEEPEKGDDLEEWKLKWDDNR